MTDEKDIRTIPIYDRKGNLLGNITGRKDEVERFKNDDLARQLEIDRERHDERLRK